MAKEDLFKLSFSDEGGINAEFKNTDEAVMALSDWVTSALEKHDQAPLSVLFSVVVHVLAREASGKFEEQFLENVRKIAPQYREQYRKAMLQKFPEFVLDLRNNGIKS